MKCKILTLFLAALLIPAAADAAQKTRPAKKVKRRHHVSEHMVKMRDGVKLYTVVVLPEKGKKLPTVIRRTPYAPKVLNINNFYRTHAPGYAVIYQECRGTGRSEGDCIPYVNEHNDGLDLLAWIRKQKFYNGEIFLTGGSYTASVHLSYLNSNQPDIKAACLAVQDSKRYNILYRKGVLKNRNWALGMYKKNSKIKRRYSSKTFRTLPLAGISEKVFGERAEFFEQEISHPDPDDPFWKTKAGGSDYIDAVQSCKVPVLLITAFYDIYTEGIFDIWNSLSEERRKDCAMIVTPFDHNWSRAGKKNVMKFPDAEINKVWSNYVFGWFDHFRTGKPLSFVKRGQIVYYPLFNGPWRYEKFLTNGKKELKLYLTQDRKMLSAPGKAGEITYLYDPLTPARFPGSGCYTFGGMQYQNKPNSRHDIISFVSEPFKQGCLVKGTGKVRLRVRSTAPDTCFYLRLSIVRKDGTLVLRDDIDTICRTVPDYKPGEKTVLNFDFAEHCYQVQKGERLRLDVSSSCFPQYLVHTNRRGPMVEQTGADKAFNTIITDGSFLTLFTD